MAHDCVETLGFNPHEVIGTGNSDALHGYNLDQVRRATFTINLEVGSTASTITEELFPDVCALGLDEKDEVRRQIARFVWNGLKVGTVLGKGLTEAELI